MRAKGLCNPSPLQNLHQLGLIDIVAHRSHLYQRLVIAGYSHRAVTLLDLGLAVLGAVLWTVAAPGSDCAVAATGRAMVEARMKAAMRIGESP